MSGIQKFQCDRCHDRRNHDQQDYSCEIFGIDHSHRKSFLCHDQCNFTAGHHSHADLEGVASTEAKYSGHGSASDDFGDQRHDYEKDTEKQERRT